MDGGEEVSGGFVVAGGDGAELLEFGEEILDQMARFVEVSVEVARQVAMRSGRDDRRFAGGLQQFDDAPIGVESLVSDQGVGPHPRQQMIRSDQIVGLPAGQVEADWVAERIDQSVDLGAQSTAGSSDRLVLAGFFLAPALC